MTRPWSGSALAVVCLALAAMLGGIGAPAGSRGAQPVGTPIGEPDAAGREILLQAALERSGSEPVALQLLRITLEAGGRSPLHAHPGLEFGVIESGRLTVRVTGRAVVLPAGARAGEGSQALPEGVEVTLAVGDRIAYAPGTAMTFRNPGPERTTLLAATVLSAGPEAPPGALYPGGTPTADDVASVRSEILGEAVTEAVPQGRSAITLERLSLRSGAAVPGYAGPVLVAVEEGGLSGAVLAGEAEVAAGTPGAAPNVGGAAGFRLSVGQSLFLPRGMAETPPLGGEGTVVLLRLGILALPEEAGTPVATPAATPEEASAAGAGNWGLGARMVAEPIASREEGKAALEGDVFCQGGSGNDRCVGSSGAAGRLGDTSMRGKGGPRRSSGAAWGAWPGRWHGCGAEIDPQDTSGGKLTGGREGEASRSALPATSLEFSDLLTDLFKRCGVERRIARRSFGAGGGSVLGSDGRGWLQWAGGRTRRGAGRGTTAPGLRPNPVQRRRLSLCGIAAPAQQARGAEARRR